mmetsp:Transcript_6047/g.23974  ORF Transcript_6047/g.23974 Transcript_6047/m.23974 type:complete len:159 (-) Transcript_6047:8843-9319(-)
MPDATPPRVDSTPCMRLAFGTALLAPGAAIARGLAGWVAELPFLTSPPRLEGALDESMRELLDDCRRRNIDDALLIMAASCLFDGARELASASHLRGDIISSSDGTASVGCCWTWSGTRTSSDVTLESERFLLRVAEGARSSAGEPSGVGGDWPWAPA